MLLFRSGNYLVVDSEVTPVLPTRLGTLGRQYTTNSSDNPVKPLDQYCRHTSRRCAIYRWDSPNCVLEELVISQMPTEKTAGTTLDCQAIIIRIQQLVLRGRWTAKLSWLPGYRWSEGYPESGEGLAARSWLDNVSKVSIGTEDYEYLAARGAAGRWMPRRMATLIESLAEDIVRVEDDSISICLPELEPGEQCQLQFVVAGGQRKSEDLAIWYAVDRRYEELLKYADVT